MSDMNESRTSLNGGGAGADHYGSGADQDADSLIGFEQHKNPFTDPGDEEIFTFKDKERTRKERERQTNKKLKIWEKNRPTREGCLRKLCETDIEPAALAINPDITDKINVAEAAGFNVPVERPKNRENRWDLIKKKREMFLVQMLLEKKDKEIERLSNFNEMRHLGLDCSATMLEKDTQSFLEFFAKIKTETSKATAQLEQAKKERNDKTMHLRTINDQCAALQSKINKKLEQLNTYHGYKVFLDELRNPSSKEQDKLKQAQREEQKNQKKAQSMDTSGGPRRGRGTDPQGRSIPAQGRAANAAQDNTDPNNLAQYEVEYSEKLKQLFDEDSENESYELPFQNPEQLMDHFVELEEKNLSHIQQWQENEQQTEIKRKEFLQIQNEKYREIQNLKNTVEENKMRSQKIGSEKNTLEMQTSKGSENLMNEATYRKIVNRISMIRGLYDKKRAKASNQTADATTQLVEIEAHINRVLKFLQLAKIADSTMVTKHMRTLLNKAKIQKKEDSLAVQAALVEEQARRLQVRKNAQVYVKGIRRNFKRSEKPTVQKREEKREELSEAQVDIERYLGMQLEDEEKKQQQ